MGYEVSDFPTDVLDASASIPVLVDFWAPWCGPCRQLGPVLERLAKATDAWRLVKVNTDQNPGLARQYGVRGIPAVKLFVDGTVEAEFTGALPEHRVRAWLEAHLPRASASRIAQAREALDAGDDEEAEHLLWPVLEADADDAEALLLMARALAFRDPKRARALADSAEIADPSRRQTQESVQTIARLVALAQEVTQDPSALPDAPGRDAYADALTALADRDFATAVERFIDVVQSDRDYDDDGARKACVAIFTLLGPQHPVTQQHRRTFDMALY